MKTNRLLVSLVLVAVVVLAACQAAPIGGNVNTNANLRTVSVTGNGRVYLAPDVAYVYIGVHSQAENVGDALTQNNAQAQAIAQVIRDLGVEDKDIQTSSFNVYPQQQYDNMGQPTVMTYSVDNTVNVTVRDLAILGQLLDSVVQAGANNINGISFDVLDKSAAITEARKLAIADAKAQAGELASAAGVSLGDLLSVTAYTNSGSSPLYDAKSSAMMAGVGGEVSVSSGQLMISVDANLTYEIR